MKYRKKYTPEEAENRLESLLCSLNNYKEELMLGYTPLILAMAHKTEEQAREDARKKIRSIADEILYIRNFL